MLLAVDIGNTNIVAALCENGRVKDSVRFETRDKRAKKLLSCFKTAFIEGAVISSVVPDADKRVSRAVKELYGISPLFISSEVLKGILAIKLSNKKEVGADRLVNAYAAEKLYGAPSIIVDFGTATTFCAVDRNGAYLGGAIAPGIAISRDALHEKTAKLPSVELNFPPSAIGHNTAAAMQSGILYGYVGIVESIIARFRKILGKDAIVIATGGLAGKISSKTDIIEIVDPDLTLKGLSMIWDRIWKTSR